MLKATSRRRLLAVSMALAMIAGLMGPAIAQACAMACEEAAPEPVEAETAHCAMQSTGAACCTKPETPKPTETDASSPVHGMSACECSLTAPAVIPLARAAESRIFSQPISSYVVLSDASGTLIRSPFMSKSGNLARHKMAPAYRYHCAILC